MGVRKQVLSVLAVGLGLGATPAEALIYADIKGGYAFTGDSQINNFSNEEKGNFGYEANVGIFFLPFLGAEVGYNSFWDVTYKNNNTGASETANLNGYHIALKGQVDLPLDIFVMGKAGVGSMIQGAIDGQDKTNYNLYWSLGAGYNINDYVYVNGSYTQIQGSNNIPAAGLAGVGVGINFL